MNRYISVLLISVMAFSPALISAAELAPKGFTFQKDLKRGDSNIEVTYLQRILNLLPETTVAKTGAGSKGKETKLFGDLTEKAVIKFQEKYKSEILAPAGLSKGTGFVGGNTRNKLNAILQENSTGTSTPKKPSSDDDEDSGGWMGQLTNPGGDVSKNADKTSIPTITTVSDFHVAPGDTLLITGSGFSGKIETLIGGEKCQTQVINNLTMRVRVPDMTGVKILEVKNETGSSLYISPVFLIITIEALQYLSPGYAEIVKTTTKINEALGISKMENDFLGNIDGGSGNPLESVQTIPEAPKTPEVPGGGNSPDGGDSGGGNNGLIVGGVVAGGLIAGASLLGSDSETTEAEGTDASSAKHDFFGGMIMFTTTCTCTFPFGSTLATISDYSLKNAYRSYMYMPGISKLHANFNIYTPGVYVIGGHNMIPNTCMVYAGTTCVSRGVATGGIDFLRGVGTSELP